MYSDVFLCFLLTFVVQELLDSWQAGFSPTGSIAHSRLIERILFLMPFDRLMYDTLFNVFGSNKTDLSPLRLT